MERIEKVFDELTAKELYEILKARIEIFVVEQKCIYQDLDDIDYGSLHIFYQEDDGKVAAYLRLFPKDGEAGTIQMGRVLTRKHGIGLGGKILQDGIQAARKIPGIKMIYAEAQEYAAGYYEREGFKVTSETFLEDGIPHVQMRMAIEPLQH